MIFRKPIILAIGVLLTFCLVNCTSSVPKGVATKVEIQKKPDYRVKFLPLNDSLRKLYRDSVDSYFSKLIVEENFNGMFLVAKNGKIIYERYMGVANEETGEQFRYDTPMHVASISKVITATMVLRLVDQKKLKLDDPLNKYITDFPYPEISVRMCLNHRTGLPYYGYYPDSLIPKGKLLTNQGVLELLKAHHYPLYFPANTQFSYCNTNYAMLALLIEKITKKPFPQVIQEEIFDPLRMTHSYIKTDTILPANFARSYDSRGNFERWNEFDGIYGDKNMYTTAHDLLKFDKALYSGKFVSKAMKLQMMMGYSYEHPGKSNYGLGFRLREEAGKSTFIFHTGWWHGNTGCYARLQKDSVCIIIISNHYTKRVFGINQLSMLFGNYPFAPLIDTKENFMSVEDAKEKLRKKAS